MRRLCFDASLLGIKYLVELFRIEFHLKFLPFKIKFSALTLLPVGLGTNHRRVTEKIAGRKINLYFLNRKQRKNTHQKKGDREIKITYKFFKKTPAMSIVFFIERGNYIKRLIPQLT